MEKYQECLEQAKKHFKIADHMAYVTFPLLQDYHLIIKIISELSEAVVNLIKSFLYYEYSLKKIILYRDPQMNLKTFREKIAPQYINKQNFEILIELLELNKKHKNSSMEFIKNNKFVILLNDKYETLDMEHVKEFLGHVRKTIESFPEN